MQWELLLVNISNQLSSFIHTIHIFCRVADNGNVHGQFWKYPVVEARNLTCISFQGHVKKLVPLLTAGLQTQKSQLAMLDRAEIPLHDEYGSTDYWKVP